MEYPEEVKKLAETLKNSGLAASMEDALDRAEAMLAKKEAEEEPVVKEERVEKKIDAAQTTLSEASKPDVRGMVEDSEAKEELEKEEVFAAKAEEEKPSKQKKIDYSREKKVDLSEVFNVNK